MYIHLFIREKGEDILKSDLTTFYRFQKEINVNNPALDHVVGVGYTITL